MEELSRALEDVFRREKSRVVGALVRVLGGLDVAEEAFQEAALAALASWPTSGRPTNPAAWLTTAAKNWARDAGRHRDIVARKAPLLVEDEATAPPLLDPIGDDELRLLFACCHPVLTLESQVALTLKVVAGFTTEEIARAFVCPERTIAQRIVRAKRTIEEQRVPFVVPEGPELEERLAAVLTVVYLLFNEGHTARAGKLMRIDLQAEAMRLARVLCDLLPDEPDVYGVYALIAFGVARAASRTDARGELVLLADQDRSSWDRRAIKEGLVALQRARRLLRRGPRESAGHVLEAEIAACHATATTWEATDWTAILRAYDALVVARPSPVVALNRAVAVCMCRGPAEALAEIAPLEEPLAGYHLFHAMRADFRSRLGEDARDDYRRALELTQNESERAFLRRKLDPTG